MHLREEVILSAPVEDRAVPTENAADHAAVGGHPSGSCCTDRLVDAIDRGGSGGGLCTNSKSAAHRLILHITIWPDAFPDSRIRVAPGIRATLIVIA